MKDERFIKPTGKQLCDLAILFNDGKIDRDKLADMVAMCTFVIDRLYDNGNVDHKSKQEIEDELPEFTHPDETED